MISTRRIIQFHGTSTRYAKSAAQTDYLHELIAVYELLGSDAQTGLLLEPFPQSADALGSNPHFVAGHVGTLGISRGSASGGGTTGQFHTLPPPSCR